MRATLVAIPLALALAGCDVVFDLDTDVPATDASPSVEDLDLDGVPDDMDLCLAPMAEAALDYDIDGVPNEDDRCPGNDTRPNNDSDSDGIEDSCDPHNMLAGDRYRCVMAFSDPALSAALWHPRGTDEEPWAPATGSLAVEPTNLATAIATRSLEGSKETSYYALMKFTLTSPGSATLWMRASEEGPSTDDLGCRFDTTSGAPQAQIVRGSDVIATRAVATLPSTLPHGNILRLRASFTTSGDTTAATCVVVANGQTAASVTATPPLPATGHVGVSVYRWPTRLELLAVYDRP